MAIPLAHTFRRRDNYHYDYHLFYSCNFFQRSTAAGIWMTWDRNNYVVILPSILAIVFLVTPESLAKKKTDL
jgi:hypothetical protein